VVVGGHRRQRPGAAHADAAQQGALAAVADDDRDAEVLGQVDVGRGPVGLDRDDAHAAAAQQQAQAQADLAQPDDDDVVATGQRTAADDGDQAPRDQAVDQAGGRRGGQRHAQQHRHPDRRRVPGGAVLGDGVGADGGGRLGGLVERVGQRVVERRGADGDLGAEDEREPEHAADQQPRRGVVGVELREQGGAEAPGARRLAAAVQAVGGQRRGDRVGERDHAAVRHVPDDLGRDGVVEDRDQQRHAGARVLGDQREPQGRDVVAADDGHEARPGPQRAGQLAIARPVQPHAAATAPLDLAHEVADEVVPVAEDEDRGALGRRRWQRGVRHPGRVPGSPPPGG
jgi:hypothetical protein